MVYCVAQASGASRPVGASLAKKQRPGQYATPEFGMHVKNNN